MIVPFYNHSQVVAIICSRLQVDSVFNQFSMFLICEFRIRKLKKAQHIFQPSHPSLSMHNLLTVLFSF